MMRFLSGAFRLCGALFATAVLFAGLSMSVSQAGERWDSFVDDLPSMPRVSVPDIPMPRVYVPDVRLRWREYGEPVAVQPQVAVPASPLVVRPPDRFDASALSSSDIVRALRANGYSMLGQVSRHGRVYTAAVLNPRGNDGLAVIDARSGAIVRFIPGFANTARLDAQLSQLYGAPGYPPITPDVSGAPRSSKPHVVKREALPKVEASPKVVARVPSASAVVSSVTSKSETAKSEVAKPSGPEVEQTASTPANPADAHAEMKPVPAPEVKPAATKLWPTSAMPNVQPLD